MYLIPRPKEYKETLEQFTINKKTKIVLSNDCTSNELEVYCFIRKCIPLLSSSCTGPLLDVQYNFKFPKENCFLWLLTDSCF